MGRAWDGVILLDAQADTSATSAGVTAFELPATAENLRLTVNQSGTASTVLVETSLDDASAGGYRTLISVAASATEHAVTVIPRFIRAYITGTADSHVVVKLSFTK